MILVWIIYPSLRVKLYKQFCSQHILQSKVQYLLHNLKIASHTKIALKLKLIVPTFILSSTLIHSLKLDAKFAESANLLNPLTF